MFYIDLTVGHSDFGESAQLPTSFKTGDIIFIYEGYDSALFMHNQFIYLGARYLV